MNVLLTCPNCNQKFSSGYEIEDYCPKCGFKIELKKYLNKDIKKNFENTNPKLIPMNEQVKK